MTTIGAFEAKNHLGRLLDAAERGEETLITRHGKPVARLVPAAPPFDREAARAAIQRIRDRAERAKLKVTLEELLAWRDEGRQ